MTSNSGKCVNMEIETVQNYGIGEEKTISKMYVCRKKEVDASLYHKLFDMGYEGSFVSNACPFYPLYKDKITECPCYQEKTK